MLELRMYVAPYPALVDILLAEILTEAVSL